LIAFHGGPGLDHHVLLPLGVPLARRCSVWLPDLPGNGASPPLAGRRPGLWTTLDTVKRWLVALEGDVDVLLGHSLGAWLVQEILRSGEVRPRAAVLLAPLAGDREPSDRIVRRKLGRRRAGRDRGLEELLCHVDSEIEGELPPAFVKTVASGRLRPVTDYVELLDELRRELEQPMRPFDPGCPVLVVGGERDRTTSAEAVERVARAIAGAELEILAGKGHYPFLEADAGLAELIGSFLDRLGD
jgi:pimeloyl-ACP methyl ester carboxylesterase